MLRRKIKTINNKLNGYYNSIYIMSHSFFTYWMRPCLAKDVSDIGNMDLISSEVAIVMQGKSISKDNFTLETLKLYKSLYKKCTIILSTWEDETPEFISIIEALGIYVVLNKIPKPLTGYRTTELQRISSISGIRKALEFKPKYILKTRTDQRFYQTNVFDFLVKLQSSFPLKLKCEAKGRLLVCSMCTFCNRLYNISDMFTFGYSEDVLRYFSCPSDTREHNSFRDSSDPEEYSKTRPGEIYFSSHYIESLGFNLKWDREDSNYYIKELFLVFDNEMIDLFWPKYTKKEYRWRYYGIPQMSQITFKEWLRMQ